MLFRLTDVYEMSVLLILGIIFFEESPYVIDEIVEICAL